ncbi:MAG: DUF4173 domain-containing protein [Planctomycetaceae bacterium]|nr:DUF4173 domain-containing protein [Planctomycetaceae bacterium]
MSTDPAESRADRCEESSFDFAETAASRTETFLSKSSFSNNDSPQQTPFQNVTSSGSTLPPVGWREIFAVLLAVVLVDTTLYHGAGFAGLAVFVIGLPLLLLLGMPFAKVSDVKMPTEIPKRRRLFLLFLFFTLTLVTSWKLLWCGFWDTYVIGLFLVFGTGVLLAGQKPRFVSILWYAVQAIFTGGVRLVSYEHSVKRLRWFPTATGTLAIVIPLFALVVFGTIFIFANPNLLQLSWEWLQESFQWLHDHLTNWFPSFWEVLLWGCAVWFMAGYLRPLTFDRLRDPGFSEQDAWQTNLPGLQAGYYASYRNTLMTVIVLFAVYLVFEFQTLWLHPIPEKFDYVGYAHLGAAWLTLALAISTVILSTVFQQNVYADKRVSFLKTLAWIWSAENIILAVAVYHRLMIYIGYNGMTRMRMVGLLGITAVLTGFIFVMVKIAKRRSFPWLLQRYFWTVLVMVFLYGVLPVDMIAHSYNTHRALDGYYPPTVQMCVHPNSSEGYLTMIPLMDCPDEVIREGVRAQLAKEWDRLRLENRDSSPLDKNKYLWTKYQVADAILSQRLAARQEELKLYLDSPKIGNEAIKRFYDYTYSKWY